MFGQVVRDFDRVKGYGFILPIDEPTLPDVFCTFFRYRAERYMAQTVPAARYAGPIRGRV